MGILGPLRRGSRTALGVALAIALLAWPAAILSQSDPLPPPEPREAKVQLAWSPDFTATDVVVAEKETLSIAIEPILPGAEERGVFIRERLAAIGGLDSFVGRIGDGESFKVGREYKQVVTSGGRLSLRWELPREYAQFVRGFTAAIRVEPAPPVVKIEPPDNGIDTDGNTSDTDGNVTDLVNESGSGPDTTNTQTDIVNQVENMSTDSSGGGGDGGSSGGSGTQGTGTLGVLIPWLAGALVLLVAAAAIPSLRRVQRRRTIERTRSMLSVSPSLDLAEGECRGGSLRADGPSASLRARLEEGRVREVGGGEDG